MTDYGLIGGKLGHSFSKIIHNQIADYNYDLVELTSEGLKNFMTSKAFKAVNVTLPYKQEVIPYLDEMSMAARSIGAVNCVKNENGKLIGHNTDFDGLKALIEYMGLELKDKWVLILGTGGTSDTAKAVCEALGVARVIKVSRTGKDGSITYEEALECGKAAEIIINTTPVGMYPNNYNQAINLEEFPNLEGVIDIVYNPLRTSLVSQALSLGIKAQGGLYMLVAQAVYASEFFIDCKYDKSIIEKVYKKLLREKTNIVLTGMPACGKSTIGKILAERLDREIIDIDRVIETKMKMPISKIFESRGEAYFRNLETEAVKEASKNCGVVIATGGGAVLREENISALKQNGQIFFIDRDVEKLIPTKSRPTALNKEAIKKRYEERYEIYKATSDVIIKNDSMSKDAADKILEVF